MTETTIEETIGATTITDTTYGGAELPARRTFAAEMTPGDGRTVDVRIVPYGERVVHNDGLGGLPKGVDYTEEFVDGVFDAQLNAANRVFLDVEHEGHETRQGRGPNAGGIVGVIGHGLALRSVPGDGLYGSFRVHETQLGDTALELVRAGSLTGASVECFFKRSIRGADGVVRRVKAHLERVGLAREPAYSRALVLGVRTSTPAPVLDETLLPVPFDPDLALRISALGITLPDRLVEHPATDTLANDASTPSTTPSTGEPDNPKPEV